MNKYLVYYESQYRGRNLGGLNRGRQRGGGLGSFLQNLLSKIVPLIKSGSKAFGRELVDTSVGLLKDSLTNKPLKASIQSRLGQAASNLSDKASNKISNLMGLGFKRKRLAKNSHYQPRKRQRRIDIFGF
jgi:hypothetical protein